jgi:Ubiquitin carboxyl-terminal hydrolase
MSCKQFTMFESHRSIATRNLPPILSMNTSVYNQENVKFWIDSRNETFLKSRIRLNGQVDGIDDPESAIYELRVWALDF